MPSRLTSFPVALFVRTTDPTIVAPVLSPWFEANNCLGAAQRNSAPMCRLRAWIFFFFFFCPLFFCQLSQAGLDLFEIPINAGKILVDSFCEIIEFLLIVLSVLPQGFDIQL